ncbi:MAG: sensor histidine kinase [Ekhidna sp.]
MIQRLLILFPILFGSLSSHAQETPIIFEGDEIYLKGEWNLVMNSFLSYPETTKSPDKAEIDIPSTWNNVIWNGEKVGSFGFGTYYKTIVIGEDISTQYLAIEVPEVSIAYRLYANEKLIGQVGVPGKNKSQTRPKIDFQVYDFEIHAGDTVTFTFHISNFSNQSGGLWYAPKLAYKKDLQEKIDLNRSLKLIIIGCILIGALFQLSIFLRKRNEKSAFYFFLICLSLSMLLVTRGDLPIIDLFPKTSWVALKKTLYLSIILIGPVNALFLRETFPKFFHKKIANGMGVLALALSLFTLVVSPRITYSIIPFYHVYNVFIGIYLFVCLVRAAIANRFGARFLLVGYLAAFLAVLHDLLSSNYVIPAFSFDMMHAGIAFYILQLMFMLTGRYLFALEGKEQLSAHLEKVNKELEEMVDRRTKALKDKNEIIELKNAELEQAMKEKDHLMAVVAHDLKAPLSSIQGISELMKSDLKGQTAEFNEMIKKVTVDGRAMIENLTELKVFEQDDFEVNKSSFDLADFFEQKKIAFHQLAEKKDIQLNASLDLSNKQVISDSNVLGRITDNLLSNAIKFTSRGGKVDFNLSNKNGMLVLCVEDNGLGFNDKDKTKVFQKFQRLSSRPTAGESSAGLGLSIVKTLVEKLGGTIALESEKGKGAKFTVSILLDQK